MKRFKQTAMAALLAAGFMLIDSAESKALYTIKDLGALGGRESGGAAINDSGHVTGTIDFGNLVYGQYHAFVTSPGEQMTDLGTLGGLSSNGLGINASGQVTGSSTTVGDLASHAFVTDTNGGMVDLGTLGGTNSSGQGINASGQVTGSSGTTDDLAVHAFVTDANGKMADLGTLGGLYSTGQGINNSGQVTGDAYLTADPATNTEGFHAFVTDTNRTMIDLGTLGGQQSSGHAINASGQVTGNSTTAGNHAFHAFVTDTNGTMIDLGTLGGRNSYGQAINDSGQVIGSSDTADGHVVPFITDANGVMTDLNDLLLPGTGWILSSVSAINNAGQITGVGLRKGGDFLGHAFLLTPGPPPANRANGVSFKLTEAQYDGLKCNAITKAPDSQLKSRVCVQSTTGAYDVTVKLSEATLLDNQIDITKDTQFSINFGGLGFSASLTSLPAFATHESSICTKWRAAETCPFPPPYPCSKVYPPGPPTCVAYKKITHDVLKIQASTKNDLLINLTGKKSVFGGLQLYAGLCQASGAGKSNLSDFAVINLGWKPIYVPINITCNVKKSIKKPVYSTPTSFELINMTINAEQVPTK